MLHAWAIELWLILAYHIHQNYENKRSFSRSKQQYFVPQRYSYSYWNTFFKVFCLSLSWIFSHFPLKSNLFASIWKRKKLFDIFNLQLDAGKEYFESSFFNRILDLTNWLSRIVTLDQFYQECKKVFFSNSNLIFLAVYLES